MRLELAYDSLTVVGKPSRLASGGAATQEVRRDALLNVSRMLSAVSVVAAALFE